MKKVTCNNKQKEKRRKWNVNGKFENNIENVNIFCDVVMILSELTMMLIEKVEIKFE